MSAGGGYAKSATNKSHGSCIQCSFDAMSAASPADAQAIRAALSQPRTQTYLTAAGGDLERALKLYCWNARISAALMVPAHFAEVTTRNAAADALEAVYGPRWPWSASFERSLQSPQRVYSPKRDLLSVRGRYATAGKVIAELKFAFWESLFTSRHDTRLWSPHIASVFPEAPAMPPASLRDRVNKDLETIRRLRNRIAHHEPILSRNLLDDLNRMLDLVELRSRPTATWVRAMEEATVVLGERP